MNEASTARRHYTMNVLMDVNLTDVSINQQKKKKKDTQRPFMHSYDKHKLCESQGTTAGF